MRPANVRVALHRKKPTQLIDGADGRSLYLGHGEHAGEHGTRGLGAASVQLPFAQHDLAHRSAAGGLDAGEQLPPALPPQPSWRIFGDDLADRAWRSAP